MLQAVAPRNRIKGTVNFQLMGSKFPRPIKDIKLYGKITEVLFHVSKNWVQEPFSEIAELIETHLSHNNSALGERSEAEEQI